MQKESKIVRISLVSFLLMALLFIVIFTEKEIRKNNGIITKLNNKKEDNTIYKQVYSINKFLDMCKDVQGNVWQTECIITQLDRASAEREWKQLKLETADESNINPYEIMDSLKENQLKIRKWREGFETMRDNWCSATIETFYGGSGTPGSVASCKLQFETDAIDALNYIYYDKLNGFPISTNNFLGIENFEPTDEDIDKIVETNKTSRGCIWYGETNCN